MSRTEAGLLEGEMKATEQIKNELLKAAKAAWFTVAQAGYSPGIVQPGATQPGATQSGSFQPDFAQAAVP